jgi:hypothetical protein
VESLVRGAGWGPVALCENCEALVDLTLSGKWPAPAVTAVLQVCSPNLEVLSLAADFRAGDYKVIASRLPQLRQLRVNPNVVDDAALLALAAGCPKLRYVPLSGHKVTDVGVLAVARNGALTSFSLQSRHRATDAGILAVAAHCSLNSIDLRSCTQFTDAALIAVAEGRQLERVMISGCFSLTDSTLVAIGQHCPNLWQLHMDDTRLMTQAGLTAIATGCPLLRELSVSNCCGVGPAMEAVARHCPRLRYFIANRAGVPARAVLALAECCPLLEDVNLSHCRDVGDKEITALVRGCRHLKSLRIEGTAVTLQGVRAVRDHCEALSRIGVDNSVFPSADFAYGFFPTRIKCEFRELYSRFPD